MPQYRFKSTTPDGQTREGTMDAPDESAVVAAIQGWGEIPVRVVAGGGRANVWRLPLRGRRRTKVGSGEVLVFTRELATLLEAGLPLDQALTVQTDLMEGEAMCGVLESVLERVRNGAALSDALAEQGEVFSRFYLSMVQAGEASGAMVDVLKRLAEHLERSKELHDTIMAALIYPAILVVMSVLSLFLLLTFVVPQFQQLFADAGKALPVATQVVIAVADFLQDFWWALIGAVVIGVFAFRWLLADSARRFRWDGWLLRWPVVGDLVAKVEVARVSRTLGTLLRNGVPVLRGLSIVKDTLTNAVLTRDIETTTAALREGQGIAEPLMATGRFPKLALHMIKVGEETGRLEEMLLRVAETYDREVKTAVQRALALLEPILIVGLGVLIAGIIMSILVAILSINELAF